MARLREGRAFWAKLVEKFEGSGERHEAYAARHGVPLTTFRTWLYRLRWERKGSAKRRGLRVLPVRVVEQAGPGAASASVTIEIAGGVTMRVSQGSEPQYVAALVSALRATC
jgi:hypothetical protein